MTTLRAAPARSCAGCRRPRPRQRRCPARSRSPRTHTRAAAPGDGLPTVAGGGGIGRRNRDPGDAPRHAPLRPALPAPAPRRRWFGDGERHDRAAHVSRVQVDLLDVIELDGEDLADARCMGALPRGGEVGDLQHRHVAADVGARALELPRRGPRAGLLVTHRRDDLEEGVPDREHRVGEAEVGDGGIAIGLAEAELLAEPPHRSLEIVGAEDRLSQARGHGPTARSRWRARSTASPRRRSCRPLLPSRHRRSRC